MECATGFKNVTVNISNGLFFFERCSLPLEKDGALHLNKTWIPFTQECFEPSFVEIDPVVLEKNMKLWKVYANANDDDGQRTNFDQKTLLEPSAQVSLKDLTSRL